MKSQTKKKKKIEKEISIQRNNNGLTLKIKLALIFTIITVISATKYAITSISKKIRDLTFSKVYPGFINDIFIQILALKILFWVFHKVIRINFWNFGWVMKKTGFFYYF